MNEFLANGIKEYNEGDYIVALESLDKALELDPLLPEAYYYKGLIFMAMEYDKDCLDNFNKAIELKPDYTQAIDTRSFFLETMNC